MFRHADTQFRFRQVCHLCIYDELADVHFVRARHIGSQNSLIALPTTNSRKIIPREAIICTPS